MCNPSNVNTQVFIPDSDKLTYTNGFYIDCYSIFIDVRDSSKLPERFQKKTLAKIYRAFISEIVAIFQSYGNCKEINIVGDSVWAIFSSKTKSDVLEVFSASYTSHSLVKNLNYKLCKKGLQGIKIGIGIGKGSALMVKAGFKGSGINDTIYMGHVVNKASKMCSKANKEVSSEIVIDQGTYNDLSGYQNAHNVTYQSMFSWNYNGQYYHASIIRLDMNDWLTQKQKISPC